MAPLVSAPRCATHRPLTMIGDIAVKNLGRPGKSFLRQITLPVAASRQDRSPLTPSVTTLPSPTAGELRGPGCDPGPPPVGALAGYLSTQICFPVAASRH